VIYDVKSSALYPSMQHLLSINAIKPSKMPILSMNRAKKTSFSYAMNLLTTVQSLAKYSLKA
jgi:hypothetical protein